MSKLSNFLDTTYTKILLGATCVALLAILFMQKESRKKMEEVSKLPFYDISLDDVQDGDYSFRTETSFFDIELNVIVRNHKIEKIVILDSQGSAGNKNDLLIKEIIENNSCSVPLIDGDELGGIILISCVDSALKKGLIEQQNSIITTTSNSKESNLNSNTQ